MLKEHKMVLFDVKSLFANVPLNRAIDIILKGMYKENEIVTAITKNEMKDCVRKMFILPLNPEHMYKQMV